MVMNIPMVTNDDTGITPHSLNTDYSSGEEQSQEDNDTLGFAELTSDELKAAFR